MDNDIGYSDDEELNLQYGWPTKGVMKRMQVCVTI